MQMYLEVPEEHCSSLVKSLSRDRGVEASKPGSSHCLYVLEQDTLSSA